MSWLKSLFVPRVVAVPEIELGPRDAIIVECEGSLTHDQRAHIRFQFEQMQRANSQPLIVLEGNMRVVVWRGAKGGRAVGVGDDTSVELL